MFICKSKIINIFVFKKNLFEYLVHNCLTIDFRKITKRNPNSELIILIKYNFRNT